MEAVKVLLVDDEIDFAETLGRRLESRGFVTATAPGGQEALAKLGDEEFDVVLLDLVMPGMDGLETLREIRVRRPLTQVIMLSGRGTEDTAIEGMKGGAFDFLTKPVEIGELVDKVNDANAAKAEHQARIRKASEAERGKDLVAEQAAPGEAPQAAGPAAEGVAPQGRLLVFGRDSAFSDALIEYALQMAERLSYEVVALNAAGFSRGILRSFPTAREKVCQDFRIVSEENVVHFRQEAQKRNIPFSHVVKFSRPEEAMQEIRQQLGQIDFVVSEDAEGLIDPDAGPDIFVYSPV